jgi:hypothetical protein
MNSSMTKGADIPENCENVVESHAKIAETLFLEALYEAFSPPEARCI